MLYSFVVLRIVGTNVGLLCATCGGSLGICFGTSQFPIRFAEQNRVFDVVARIENANLAELFGLDVLKELGE